jgi:hypothetical protein
MVAFNVVGGEVAYPVSLSVTLHGMMPWALVSLLSIPVALGRDSIGYDMLKTGGVLASNAAALAPEGTGTVLLGLLASLDVFSLWSIALLAVGYSIAAKVPRARPAAGLAGRGGAWRDRWPHPVLAGHAAAPAPPWCGPASRRAGGFPPTRWWSSATPRTIRASGLPPACTAASAVSTMYRPRRSWCWSCGPARCGAPPARSGTTRRSRAREGGCHD